MSCPKFDYLGCTPKTAAIPVFVAQGVLAPRPRLPAAAVAAGGPRGPRYTRVSMTRRANILAKCLLTAAITVALTACGASGGAAASAESTSGASFSPASELPADSAFDASAATGQNGALIDISHVADGYVGASSVSSSRIKLLVVMGDSTQTYNVPETGEPIIAPLTFGNGTYTFRVMQNTSGNSYVELARAETEVDLTDEFAPYLRPNVNCDYDADSACVARARELVADAANQGEALAAICTYVVENISYDDAKAAELRDSSGYVPDPDETLADGSGICFDYASLGAAMLRSQGIPTQIVTGTVSPDGIYHAWINVYIDGTWTSASFDVQSRTWSRIDLTFAAGGTTAYVGDGKTYTQRYVY